MIPRHLLIAVAALLVLVVSMGFYLRHMRLRAGQLESPAADTSPVAPPAAGPTETVTLYVADDASAAFAPARRRSLFREDASSAPKICCARSCASTSSREPRIHCLPRRISAPSI